MRNLVEYPIDAEEVLNTLERLKKEYIDSGCIGGTQGMILGFIIEFLDNNDDTFDEFLESKRGSP
jgi:hypothetical protein